MTRTQVHPQGSLQYFIKMSLLGIERHFEVLPGEVFKVGSGFPFPYAGDDGNVCFPKVEQKNGEIIMALGSYVAIKMFQRIYNDRGSCS